MYTVYVLYSISKGKHYTGFTSGFYYPELEHKLTHLFFSINKNHSFQDGNKRASIVLSAYFLEINNCSFRTMRFLAEMENVAVDVADNRIDKDLLFEVINSIIYEDDYSEELKLKIIYAKGLDKEDWANIKSTD